MDKELRKFVRKSPAVRRMIKWNPAFRWVWQWYQYLNPEPVANQRPDNNGWVEVMHCTDGFGSNLNSYLPTCPKYSPVDVKGKPAANVRNWWRVYWDTQHNVYPWIYRGDLQSRWMRQTGNVPRDKKWPQEWYAPQKHPVPQEFFLPRVDPFFVPPGFTQPSIAPAPRAVSRHQWSTAAEGNWSEVGPAPTRRPREAQEYEYKETPPKTKERKTKVRRAAVFLLRQAYKATEAVDAINALHDGVGPMPSALPKEYRAKSGKIQDKAAALYRHWDKIDVEQAVLNLAANQFLDLLVGVPQGKAQEWATERGIFLGGGVTGARGI